jgi:plasmid stabilization system protein ParE
MSDEGADDADKAAQRLETALERIAQMAAKGGQAVADRGPTAEVAARLDAVIERLRAALSGEP